MSSPPCRHAAGSQPSACVSRRFSVLTWEQVQRLDALLGESVPIHGRGNFPTLSVRPRTLVQMVRSWLELKGINVKNMRLNGSAASHVLHQDGGLGYKDLDLIFGVDLKSAETYQVVKDVVLGCLFRGSTRRKCPL
ncbi:hypothetical protein NDU88_001907 [Pleurodeles waltl]|uniref:Terminal nucleotidyltransferase 5B n=1 Tax=Pleurodeles waltl TaxID=8319 RepID=A0AAV7ML46_PLEWA|nr:hypothetical protein NDU88_001907 [Pleurodeles waltl]